jgi:hypothetical protein
MAKVRLMVRVALLKHEIHKEQIKAQAIKLQDAHDVVIFCRK